MPALAENLFSVLTITRKHGFRVMIDSSSLSFIRSNQTLFTASVGDDLVALLDRKTKIQPNSVPSHSASAALSSIPYEIWHKRLGHLGHDRLARLAKENLVDALAVELPAQSPLCVSCLDGKQKRFPFSHTGTRRSELLELVHSDLHGPLPVSTQSGFKYWISFIDDMSRFRRVYLLRKKSEAFDAFKLFHAWAEKQTGHKLKALRDDKGGEYMSNEWEKYMSERGIERQHTTRSTPQQNGVAERTNALLDEGTACLLADAHLPASFWGEALSCFLHVLNISPTSALKDKTPFEAFLHRKPSVEHLRVFGCRAYVHIQRDKRRGLQPKSEHCIFLGYPLEYRGWKCYNPSTKKVVISRDVVFVETELPGLGIGGGSGPAYVPLGSMPDAGGKDNSASGSLPTFNLSSDSSSDSGDSDSDSDNSVPPPPFAPTSHPTTSDRRSDSVTPDPDVSGSTAPSGSRSTAPGSRTAPNAGTSHPRLGSPRLLHRLLLMMMLRRLLEALLTLQAISVALLELGNRLLSSGNFLRIDSPLWLPYLMLRMKDHLARMQTLLCISQIALPVVLSLNKNWSSTLS